jgi:Rrf2 family protein
MQGLVRGGLVNSQRGLHGGFVLAKQPENLTIWAIVDVVEPIKRIHECPLGIKEHGETLCPLHRRMDKAIEAIEKIFRETTVAEMLAPSGGVTPLCEDKKLINLEMNSTRTKRQRSSKSSKTK